MAHVVVAGATGELGRRVLPLLTDAGHDVTALVRGPDSAGRLTASAVRAVEADLFDRDAVLAACAGAEAVINLATRIPPPHRAAFGRAWRDNDLLRTEASANLAAAATAHGARFVQESVVFPYADGGAGWLDEEAPTDPAAFLASSAVAEENARGVTEAGGVGVVLRFGSFVAVGSPHTDATLAGARRGVLPMLGPPDGYESLLTTDDAAAAVVAALSAPPGTYNVVEDEPATRDEHANALAAVLARSVRLPPEVLGRVGPASILARSRRVSNARLREATSWRPSTPRLADAWADLVAP